MVVSSALETSIGLRAGLALAAALPELPYACGLNTAGLLAGDLATPGLAAVDGVIRLREVEPDPTAVERHRADPAVESSGRLAWCAPGSWPVADPAGHATLCARVIVAELIRHGVTDLVLAPGSRSAPLAYEAFEADRIGLLRLHVRLDERTAGFLGLGLAKGSGAPVAVLTTSGTAAANLFPAVLEAAHAHQPLVMITASRPRALVNTGANQTTDQDQLFGRHVRAYAALSDQAADPPTWRFEVARLMAAAAGTRNRQPGPVQLNVELSDPLVPTGFDRPPAVADLVLTPAGAGQPIELAAGPQTVIVAGDAPPATGREVAQLAERAGVPLLAEPSSNARSGSSALGTARLLAGSNLAEDVERVVVYGHPTLSRPVTPAAGPRRPRAGRGVGVRGLGRPRPSGQRGHRRGSVRRARGDRVARPLAAGGCRAAAEPGRPAGRVGVLQRPGAGGRAVDGAG